MELAADTRVVHGFVDIIVDSDTAHVDIVDSTTVETFAESYSVAKVDWFI